MKIICVGRNYAKHAKELGNDLPKEPLIFLKPDTALIKDNQHFYLPEFSSEIHFECELYFKISKHGKHIDKEFALNYVSEIGLGIDFTARDIQSECKKNGLPWTLAKCFDGSAPVSKSSPIENYDLKNISFELKINGKTRQVGNTADMIFDIETLIEYTSKIMTLCVGDLIFTGTPEGVGKVNVSDHLEAFLEGEKILDFYIR